MQGMSPVTPTQADGRATPLRRPIRVLLSHGEALSEQELREMWSLRIGILRLKPRVPPEEDFARFCRTCRRCTSVVRLRSADGVLCGITVMAFHDGTFEGQPYRLLLPEYGIVDARLRGSPVVPWLCLRIIMHALWHMPPRRRNAPLFLGGIGYPTSALMLERFFPPLWLYGDAEAPGIATHLLEWMREHLAGERWDPRARHVFMPTVPLPPSERWLARQQVRSLYQRYVQRCPDWTQGYALPLLVPVNWRTPLHMLLHLLRRRWRGRQSR
jgi:hypothetical protein